MASRRYKIHNENFFEEIDSFEKAYWLGFLFADGYNNEKDGRVIISLQKKDMKFLEKLRAVFYKNRPLYFIEQNRAYSLTINSRKVSYDLGRLGCIQNKSLKLSFPQNLSSELLSHFIRGYLDGDGCISFMDKKHKTPQVQICSSNLFCKQLQYIILEKIGIRFNIFTQKDKRWSICYIGGTKKVLSFLDWVYSDAREFLPRKYKKYLEIKLLRERIKRKNDYISFSKKYKKWYCRLPLELGRKFLGFFVRKKDAKKALSNYKLS